MTGVVGCNMKAHIRRLIEQASIKHKNISPDLTWAIGVLRSRRKVTVLNTAPHFSSSPQLSADAPELPIGTNRDTLS